MATVSNDVAVPAGPAWTKIYDVADGDIACTTISVRVADSSNAPVEVLVPAMHGPAAAETTGEQLQPGQDAMYRVANPAALRRFLDDAIGKRET